MSENNKKRIAVFFYENRNINTYPYVVNSARLLAEQGYFVDIYLNESQKTELDIENCKFFIVSDLDRYNYIFNTAKQVHDQRYNYDFLFVYSPEGLLISFLLNQYAKNIIPAVYFSMELKYKYIIFLYILEIIFIYFLLRFSFSKIKFKVLKTLFIYSFQKEKMKKIIKFSVVMDKDRAEILKREFDFVDRIVLLPNSYIGFLEASSDFAYKKFNIPADKKILLFTGGIEKAVFDEKLPLALEKLGTEYTLLLSGFSRFNYLEEIKRQYKLLIENKRLVINDVNLDEQEYDELIRSCYIGLAWYKKTKVKNLYYMGLSSGKLTKYLSCKKPVIAPSFLYKYSEIIDVNQIGKTCADVSDIPEAVKQIELNYNKFTENVEKFYIENLEFEKQFQKVIKALKEIGK
ncbi:MAG TPA: hypothetical protein P5556_02975 [Candidatus Gastranaerophilales bacterium]|nr:hypothetical protein [Candidatus Gastranaerophilales bacterium]